MCTVNNSIKFFIIGVTLSSLAWFFSPYISREIAHFIGILGFPFIAYFYALMFFENSKIKVQVISVVAIYILVSFLIGFEGIAIIGINYFTPLLCFLFLAAIAKSKVLKLKSIRGVIFTCALMSIVPSIGWELVVQPFIDVYGNGARGYVQWPQFTIDLCAVLIGTLSIGFIQRNYVQQA